jgi:hypothetical protein
MTIEQLAGDLGLEVHDFWKAHWDEYQAWDGCEVCPGDIPPNAREVFDIPIEAMAALKPVCEAIRANPDLAEFARFWHYLLFHMDGGRGLPEDALPAPKVLGEQAPLFRIAVLVTGTDHVVERYRAMGVGDEIVLPSLAQCGDEMRDHYAAHGTYGMRYLGWMRNYFLAKMFRLGRLVFNPNSYNWGFRAYRNKSTGDLITLCDGVRKYRADGLCDGTNGIKDPNPWSAELEIGPDFVRGHPVRPEARASKELITLQTSDWEQVLGPGDSMIEVHIPPNSSGGRLSPEECAKSYRWALDFFAKHYPDQRFACLTCWSWLLDPALPMILPAESNIVKFMSPYHLLPVYGNENQCYDLAFGDEKIDIRTAPRDTFLRRAIVDYVLAGNRMRSTAGFMTLDEARAMTCSA